MCQQRPTMEQCPGPGPLSTDEAVPYDLKEIAPRLPDAAELLSERDNLGIIDEFLGPKMLLNARHPLVRRKGMSWLPQCP